MSLDKEELLVRFFSTWPSPPNTLPVRQKEVYNEYVRLFLTYMAMNGFTFEVSDNEYKRLASE